MVQYSHANNSDTSLTNSPLQLTFLVMTGARASIVLDKAFLGTYGLPFKDTESLTVGALKQVMYDEWTARVNKLATELITPGADTAETMKPETTATEPILLESKITETNTNFKDVSAEKLVSEPVTTTTLDPATHDNNSKPFGILDVPIESTGSLENLIDQYPILKEGDPDLGATEERDLGPVLDTAETKKEVEPAPITNENEFLPSNDNNTNVSSITAAPTTVDDISKPEHTLDPPTNKIIYTTEWADILAKNVTPAPTSPDHIRLIYFGRVLTDESTMEECNFLVPSSATVKEEVEKLRAEKELSAGALSSDDNNDDTTSDPYAAATNLPTSASNNPQQSTYVIHLSVRPPSPVSSQSKRWGKGNKKHKNTNSNSNISSGSTNDNTVARNRGSNSAGPNRGSENSNEQRPRADERSSGKCCIIS